MASTSTVSTGTLSTSGGVTKLSGTASGIDTDKLIEALTAAKRVPADRLEAKIKANEAKVSAYGELKGLLGKLKDAVAGLRNPPGTLGVNSNVFENKAAYLSSNTTTAPTSLLAVSATNKVVPGKLSLVVEQLATARKLASDSVGDPAQALAATANGGSAFSGSLTLGLAGGPTAAIAISGDMTLNDVRAAVNGQTAVTGVSANIVQVGTGDARLVLSATKTGREITMGAAAGDDVRGILGLVGSDGSFKNPISAAAPARITLDGMAITRPDNHIDDVVEGLSLDLVNADPATTVTLDVDRDLSAVQTQVVAVADAFNAVRDFVIKQNGVGSDGSVDSGAVLFGDTTLRSLAQQLGAAVTRPVAGLSGTGPTSLAGLGLKLDRSNKLALDGAALQTALTGNLDGVRGVLEFRFAASSPDLQVLRHDGALPATSFDVAVTDANGDGTPEAARIGGEALDVVGQRLVGRAGTAWAGLEMVWTGSGDAAVHVDASRGVADQLYALVDDAIDDVDGSLTKASDNLTGRNSDYTSEIGKIDERVGRYREQLLARFQSMETAMSLAKSMLQQVKSALGTSNDDS